MDHIVIIGASPCVHVILLVQSTNIKAQHFYSVAIWYMYPLQSTNIKIEIPSVVCHNNIFGNSVAIKV